MEKQDIQLVQQMINKTVSDQFSKRIGDTPTDALQLVSRKYVNLNGLTRPTSPTIGQFFLDLNLNKPIWYTGTGWIDATGASV